VNAGIAADLAALEATLRASTVAVRLGNDGAGSGVIWSRDGIIVTNAHVASRKRAEIVLADGRRFDAVVERRDAARDLALLRIDANGLPAIVARDPASVRPGEILVALGHPLGVPNALTMGIAHAVTGTGRRRFVQADLHIAPGNSGGPLADAAGNVLGINSMVVDGTLALAVPIDDVAQFAGDRDAVPRLGIELAAARMRDGSRAYVVIAVEPGSRAERSGFQLGDVMRDGDREALRTRTMFDVLRGGVPISIAVASHASARAA
jgi:serine protease Do